ncbi:MAG: hypothetical protein QM607_12145 [Microbacterium sp.]
MGDASLGAMTDAIQVDLEPLRHVPGLRRVRLYERLAEIPLRRRLGTVLLGLLVLDGGLIAATWWLAQAGILQQAPILAVFSIAYAVFAVVLFGWHVGQVSRRVKLAFFAWMNGWAYADLIDGARHEGSAFRVIRSRERGSIESDDPRMPFLLGHHYSVHGSGRYGQRGQSTIQKPFAFIELPLPRAVPNIVLKNRRRSIIPTLGLGKGAAKMALEGDFARAFTLLVSEGYQADALYVFTPDVMASVLDLARGAEVELRGEHVYIYLPHRTRFDRPEVMAHALSLAEELHRRFADQTERYRDDDELAARHGTSLGLGGRSLPGNGISIIPIAAGAMVVLLSAAVTGFTLFGGDILRHLAP